MAESRFSRFTGVSEMDLQCIVEDKNTKSTKQAMKTALPVLQHCLKEKKASEPQT